MVPLAASFGGAGVLDAHWLPDRAGEPVVWLRTRTELERVQLQAQAWVLPQVVMLMTRLSVPLGHSRSRSLYLSTRQTAQHPVFPAGELRTATFPVCGGLWSR